MNDGINHQQVAKWLRQQASKYEAMARQIEGDFRKGAANGQQNGSDLTGTLTLSQLKQAVASKAGRPADYARRFNVTVEAVNTLIDQPGSGIRRVERGWLKPE